MTEFVFLAEDLRAVAFIIECVASLEKDKPYEFTKYTSPQYSNVKILFHKNHRSASNDSLYNFWQVEFTLPLGFSSVSWLKAIIRKHGISHILGWDYMLPLASLDEKKDDFDPSKVWEEYINSGW
jgi:hypothetical protein